MLGWEKEATPYSWLLLLTKNKTSLIIGVSGILCCLAGVCLLTQHVKKEFNRLVQEAEKEKAIKEGQTQNNIEKLKNGNDVEANRSAGTGSTKASESAKELDKEY